MQVLLEMDCIPSGMELFPASDDDMWTLIKGVIDDCDYYMVIIGGRYGSTDADGTSFTEKEYRYAIETGKPAIAFLHGDPDSIPQRAAEDTDEGKRKLAAFRDLTKKKACKEWKDAHHLGSVVARSLTQLKKSAPGIGWVRGDQILNREAAAEILRLREKIEDLESELDVAKTSVPRGTEDLAQGDDKIKVKFIVTFENTSTYQRTRAQGVYSLSWNTLFRKISPLMIHEAHEQSVRGAMGDLLPVEAIARVRQSLKKSQFRTKNVEVDSESFQTIVVQLRALGLITKSTRNRSVKDTATYWTLTPYGDNVMNKLIAIKRNRSESD